MENKLFKKLTFIDKILNLRSFENEKRTIPIIFRDSLYLTIFFLILITFIFFLTYIDNPHINFWILPLIYTGIFCLCFHTIMAINFIKYTNKNLKTTINLNTDKIYKNEKSNKMITSKSGIFIVLNDYFYPKKYKNEFDKIIRKHFDNIVNITEFEEWLEYNLITVENLYYSIINKKEIQEEILKSIEETKRNNENEYLKEREKIEGLKNQIKSFQKPIIKIKVVLKP